MLAFGRWGAECLWRQCYHHRKAYFWISALLKVRCMDSESAATWPSDASWAVDGSSRPIHCAALLLLLLACLSLPLKRSEQDWSPLFSADTSNSFITSPAMPQHVLPATSKGVRTAFVFAQPTCLVCTGGLWPMAKIHAYSTADNVPLAAKCLYLCLLHHD